MKMKMKVSIQQIEQVSVLSVAWQYVSLGQKQVKKPNRQHNNNNNNNNQNNNKK